MSLSQYYCHNPETHPAELKSEARIKSEMWICSCREGLICGLWLHLFCNWLRCGMDDTESLENFWRFTPFILLDEVFEGSLLVKTLRGPESLVCRSYSMSLSLFLLDLLFVMNTNSGWRLPDADSVRGRRWGRGGAAMIEILVKLQEVIWTGACKREKEWFPSASVCTPA